MNPNMMNPNMMNPQLLMNMMNRFSQNNNNQQMVFDPTRLDKKEKSVLMRQTAYQSKFGLYKNLGKFKHTLYAYCSSFPLQKASGLCEVTVEYDHCLDVAEKYASKGTDYSIQNPLNPVVLNVVGKEFNGSNLEISEEMRDELINIRTTFNNTFDNCSQFPLKSEECTYLLIMNIIRPSYPSSQRPFIPINDVFRIGLITASPTPTQKLLSGKSPIDGKMFPNDLISTLTTIESVFQCAIWKRHSVLILPPFGNGEDNNPIDDIIKVYNYCILKYGHMFKKIIVAIPKYYPKDVYARYKKDIMKPTEMVANIDKKYEKEEVQKQVLAQQKQMVQSQPSNKKQSKTKNNEQTNNQQYSPEQVEMFMKMMTMMNNK